MRKIQHYPFTFNTPSLSPEKYDLESRQNTRTTSCSCFFFSEHFHTSSPTHQTNHRFNHHSVPSNVTKRTSPFSHPQNTRVASGLKSIQRTVPLLQLNEAIFTSFRSLYVCLKLISKEGTKHFDYTIRTKDCNLLINFGCRNV